MFPTAARLSKASRAPLTPKRGNKDFYKGTRQAFLPGGHRTGAPGKHVVKGSAKYRLLDEKVRVYVAPPVEEIEASALKPYVALGTRLNYWQNMASVGKFRSSNGLSPSYYLRLARQHTYANEHPNRPVMPGTLGQPKWIWARKKLGLGVGKITSGDVAVFEDAPLAAPGGAKGSAEKQAKVKELEVVRETTTTTSS
ncbi:hypothetical protein CVT24_012942 [Panaeolus cyanescens]|uniref:Uncharacterized protein n=1 Tax=Panaeolus cyanescens TaxID=181874 RepID=A0A409W6E8_9AGAR|nr:hypothetical protein CVT24_012942 [Panaeolus cyanescens]